jgi:DNA-binding helix-turn-helix protein
MINKGVIIMNENLDRKILGENIKKRRIELGLTQKKLASNLGVSNVSLSQYETGDVNIPLATLNELANILETTVGKLIGTKEEIEYTTDRQTLLNKAIKNTNTLAIAVEKGIDKVENIFAPILKNSLDDIVILDIDGKTYEETVNHRALEEKSLIKKIGFDYEYKFGNDLSYFNPFENINFSTCMKDTEMITTYLLGNEKNDKFYFLNSIISLLYFKDRVEQKNGIFSKITLSKVYEFIYHLNKEKIQNTFKEISELELLTYEDLGILYKKNEDLKEKQLKDFNLILQVPEFHSIVLKISNIEEEKLQKIRKELLIELYFLDNSQIKKKFKEELLKEKIQIPNKISNFLFLPNDTPLELDVFKHYDYYNDYLDYIYSNGLENTISETELNKPILRKTYYLTIKKESFEELKPIIKMFFYFIFKDNQNYNTYYPQGTLGETKNFLVFIDRFSELDLELEDLSKNGVKQILVSDLDKINKSYFKIENENMKVTEKKMEYLYKVEENGNIDFYKDTCPVSKPKKVSIEDELRTFKEL